MDEIKQKKGNIRVGRIIYKNGKKIFPNLKEGNFTSIEVMTSSTKYGSLSPYSLTVSVDKRKILLENLWQFSKVYPKTPKVCERYSRYDSTVIWQRDAETHFENEQITSSYWKWREDGFNNKYAVRYPVSYSPKQRASCLFSIHPTITEKKQNIY